jgi:hypothetical protein
MIRGSRIDAGNEIDLRMFAGRQFLPDQKHRQAGGGDYEGG